MQDTDAAIKHWLNEDAASWKGLAGLRSPDRGITLLIDGYATDDGVNFEHPPFSAGTLDVVVAVIDGDKARMAFEWLRKQVASPRQISANLEEENEVVVGYWDLPDGRGVVIAGDSGTSRRCQDAMETILERLHVPAVSTGQVGRFMRFDALNIRDDQLEKEALSGLSMLCDAVPAPPRTSRTPGV